MEQLLEAAANYYVITILGGCFIFSVIVKALTTVFTTASQEKSRREIAAYIAEGSLTPEQGERLIRADVNRGAKAA